MRCPSCRKPDTRVIDTRMIEDGTAIRRRRMCEHCGFRFTTSEEIEILTLMVRKADDSLQPYDREKLIMSMKLPLSKRPVSASQLKKVAHLIEQEIQSEAKNDTISSHHIGQIVTKYLKKLDKVAYIRYASVYHAFDDLNAFVEEVEKISNKRHAPRKSKKKK
jgi:transcriptional repressor NrdR